MLPDCQPPFKGKTKRTGSLLARAEFGYEIGLHILTGGSLDK
jgi:hypothetical protein